MHHRVRKKLPVVAHTWNSIYSEDETGGLQIWGRTELQCQCKFSLGNLVKPVSKGKSKKRAWYPVVQDLHSRHKVLSSIPSTTRVVGKVGAGYKEDLWGMAAWAITQKVWEPFPTAGKGQVSKESSKEEETLELGPEEHQRVDKVRTGFRGGGTEDWNVWAHL